MARKRVTKEEKHQRHEWAMKQIDKGVGFSELASLISETWGCTRRNARHVVSLAHKEWMEIAFGAEEIDQRDLLFQSIARPTGTLLPSAPCTAGLLSPAAQRSQVFPGTQCLVALCCMPRRQRSH